MPSINEDHRSAPKPDVDMTFVEDPSPVLTTTTRQVHSERIRVALIECAPVESVLVALFATAVLWAVWPVTNITALIAWLSLMSLPQIARAQLRRRYARTAADIRNSATGVWARRHIAISCAGGVIWGSAVLLVPDTAAVQLSMLVGLHAALVLLLAGSQAIYLPATLAFALPSSLLILMVVLFTGPLSVVTRIIPLSVLVGLAAWVCATRQQEALKKSLADRFAEQERSLKLATERDQAKLAMLAKNRFLAAASHDLRQPLHAIGLYANCLTTRFEAHDSTGVLIRLQRSIGALSSLFDGILDVSRLDAHAVENHPIAVALDPLMERLSHEYDMQARAKGLRLQVQCQHGLVAHVDPILLERVLLNLMGNAIKFTDQGEIAVTVKQTAAGISIAVCDTGCGIVEADRERVFSEYHQIQPDGSPASDGRGLGLAIVRRLCALMGGSVELSSRPGSGSVFTVSIPQQQISDDNAPLPVDETRTHLWCKRVLVIDSDQAVLDGTRRTLSRLGCRCITASTAQQAIEKSRTLATNEMPDALIVDVGLKGSESGLQAVRRIRNALGCSIPALLTTGDSACRYVAGKPTTRVRLLHKPYTAVRLREELAKLEQAHSAKRQGDVQTMTCESE